MSRRPAPDNWKGIPHCRIRADVTSSRAWRVIGPSSKALYVDLRAKLRTGNNGNISAPLSELKHVGWKSSATLAKALYELLAVGLIVRTRGGGVERGSKVCSLYAFTDMEVFENPKIGVEKQKPKFEYNKFATVAEARDALDSGVAKQRAYALNRKAQKKNSASEIEAE